MQNDSGYLYAHLTDEYLKVGKSVSPKKRLSCYRKGESVISKPLDNISELESVIISFANNLCGNPIKGNEYFSPDEINFYRISECIKSLGEKGIDSDVFDYWRNRELYKQTDKSVIAHGISVISVLKDENDKISLSERKNMLIAVLEAIEDVGNGCDPNVALFSLKEILETMIGKIRIKG